MIRKVFTSAAVWRFLALSLFSLGYAPLAVQAADVDVPDNLTMRDSTGADIGNILKEGVPFIHNFPAGASNNTFIGRNAGNFTMTGVANTASGANALQGNTTGDNNTASGTRALQGNTTGVNNTASGVGALFSNTTGNSNTASGVQALLSNTTGSNNTASGVSALFGNTTGNFNTASGFGALTSNTTGFSNTASGYQALTSNTMGFSNTASGVGALTSNTTGFSNTASGAQVLQNNTGSGNTASGVSALFSNTTGSFNTASGISALGSNTTGNNNTAIGNEADVSSGNLTNATAIGNGAIVDASNKIRLGNAQVTVVQTSGKVFAGGGFNGQCFNDFFPGLPVFSPVICNQDVAETFATLEATEPGDLVVLVNKSASMPTVRKSTQPYEGLLVGAVSTNPGLVFDRGETHVSGDNSKLVTAERTVVGLVGRVPVKVSLENGPIAVGDPLTSSSTAGVAMKATKAGQIVGYAMEKTDQKGKVLVHLQPGYYIPPKQLALLNQIDELSAQVSELKDRFQALLTQREKSAGTKQGVKLTRKSF